MTISNQSASITYTGNSVQTVFTYNFLIPYQTDGVTPAVAVYLIEDDVSTLLAPSAYTITGVGDPLGGTVTYSPAITSSQQIQINRALAYTQTDVFVNQGFLPSAIETALDLIVMQIQQLAAAAGVSVTVQPQLEAWPFALTDETTVIVSTGTYIVYDWPYDFTIEEVQGCLTTTVATANFIMDIEVNDVSILSTPITVEIGETSSLTAASQPVVASPSVARGAKVAFLVSQVGTSATGAKVTILGRQA